jgi:hypothetical protein
VALAACWIGHRASLRFHLRRFAVVSEGVLYRSAQPTAGGIVRLVDPLGVKTLVCLRREDGLLRRGLLDFGEHGGFPESIFATRAGVRHLHWPMGGEEYWPFFSGQQFEAFFRLMDDPANFPVAVHCIGGRHRTGTFVALYRMEYDRWDVERTMREMYSFDFGHPIPVQEHNLRTYVPRPLPAPAQWAELSAALGGLVGQPEDYATLMRRLRAVRSQRSGDRKADAGCKMRDAGCRMQEPALRTLRAAPTYQNLASCILHPASPHGQVDAALQSYVRQGRPFALCLLQRLIDTRDDPLSPLACRQALSCLQRPDAAVEDWASAAALLADFGNSGQQQALLNILENESRKAAPSPRYRAAVRGVTNRYTPNRVAFLKPLLSDERLRVEPEAVQEVDGGRERYRYCDTAVAHLCTILDLYGVVAPSMWEECRQRFIAWFEQHPQAALPVRLGQSAVELGSSRHARDEDRDDYR